LRFNCDLFNKQAQEKPVIFCEVKLDMLTESSHISVTTKPIAWLKVSVERTDIALRVTG